MIKSWENTNPYIIPDVYIDSQALSSPIIETITTSREFVLLEIEDAKSVMDTDFLKESRRHYFMHGVIYDFIDTQIKKFNSSFGTGLTMYQIGSDLEKIISNMYILLQKQLIPGIESGNIDSMVDQDIKNQLTGCLFRFCSITYDFLFINYHPNLGEIFKSHVLTEDDYNDKLIREAIDCQMMLSSNPELARILKDNDSLALLLSKNKEFIRALQNGNVSLKGIEDLIENGSESYLFNER